MCVCNKKLVIRISGNIKQNKISTAIPDFGVSTAILNPVESRGAN